MSVYFIDIYGQPEFGEMSELAPDQSLQSFDQQVSSVVENALGFQAPDPNTEPSPVLTALPQNLESNYESVLEQNIELNQQQNPFEAVATEITDFANQDHVVTNISYSLTVSGLDSKEIMLLFREAIDDSKFGWISQDIFNTIKNGTCVLTNLNPIQAYILAKRIQFFDLEMEWKQNVLS